MNYRRLAFTASFIFWSVMMGLLLRERVLLPAATTGNMVLGAVREIPASTTWYSIVRAERKIGYASVAVSADAVPDAVEYRIDLYSRLLLRGGACILGEIHLRDPGGIAAFSLGEGGQRYSFCQRAIAGGASPGS